MIKLRTDPHDFLNLMHEPETDETASPPTLAHHEDPPLAKQCPLSIDQFGPAPWKQNLGQHTDALKKHHRMGRNIFAHNHQELHTQGAEKMDRAQSLTRYTQADRQADPNYRLVMNANNKMNAQRALTPSKPLTPVSTPAQPASVNPLEKGVIATVGIAADEFGFVSGIAMTAVGAGLVAAPEPTTLSKWAGLPLTAYGAAYTAKSAAGVGLNATNLWSAIRGRQAESDYVPGSALELAVRASGGSPNMGRNAVLADTFWGITSGKVLDARLATSILKLPKAWQGASKAEPLVSKIDVVLKVKEHIYDPTQKKVCSKP